jgi:hypothetical protein
MRRVLPLKILLASLLVAACVTINVYFPAAAADKAADQFINDVTGGAKSNSGANTPPQSNLVPSRPDEQPDVLVAAVAQVLYALVPAANAQDAEAALNVNSPAASRIKASMAARFPELEKFFASGAVGLTKDGLIEVRDINAVALPDRATVKRLVSEDNSIALSSTPRSLVPATTRSGRAISARRSRMPLGCHGPSPAGTTRTTAAPGSRSKALE